MRLMVNELATIEDVDEALGHLRQIPPNERGPAWQAYTDKLLEIRTRHTKTTGATPIFSHKDRETTGHKNGGQNSPGTTRHHPV